MQLLRIMTGESIAFPKAVSDAMLRAEFVPIGNAQPIVVLIFCRGIAGTHDEHIADILALGPGAAIIDQV